MIKRTFFTSLLIAGFVFVAGSLLYSQATTPTKKPDTPAVKQKVKVPDAAKTAANDTARIGSDTAGRVDSATVRLYTLKVTTLPESAQVYLDDSLKGVSPCSLTNVLPGPHDLTLKKVGCYLKKAKINVDSTAPLEYSFTLLQPAFVRIESEPSGAEVSIDGRKSGVTPWENDKVKPGDYTVKIDLATYRTVEKKLTIASAARDTLRTVLVHTEKYQDSLSAAQLAEAKAKKEHFNGMLASGLFLVGAVVVVVLELINN
jgi:hypothetical protein